MLLILITTGLTTQIEHKLRFCDVMHSGRHIRPPSFIFSNLCIKEKRLGNKIWFNKAALPDLITQECISILDWSFCRVILEIWAWKVIMKSYCYPKQHRCDDLKLRYIFSRTWVRLQIFFSSKCNNGKANARIWYVRSNW